MVVDSCFSRRVSTGWLRRVETRSPGERCADAFIRDLRQSKQCRFDVEPRAGKQPRIDRLAYERSGAPWSPRLEFQGKHVAGIAMKLAA